MKKMPDRMFAALAAVALSSAVVADNFQASVGKVTPFADGERVTFLGDSITHGGRYHANLQLFWDLRFPSSGTRLMNCGVSGGTADGGAARWEYDVLPQRADRVFVMFGMNDVGRGGYEKVRFRQDVRPAQDTDEKTAAKRRACLDEYRTNMAKIADQVQSAGKKLVVITPTPYDEYGDLYKPDRFLGYNSQGLASFAKACRELAAERKAELMEFHAPLTEFVRAQRDYMFCRQVDRIHPTPSGHVIMSALILEAMDVSPVVAKVEMDADGRVRGTVRAKVSDVKASLRGISFRYVPDSLPFPTPDEYREADAVYPVSEKMNLEILEIAGLPQGEYELLADGKPVGKFSDGQFSAGVNLALLPTPGAKLAMEAWTISRELFSMQSRLRSLVLVEELAAKHGAKAGDFEDVCAKLEAFVERLKKDSGSTADYYARQLTAYRRDRAQLEQMRAKEDDLRRRLAEAAAKKALYTIEVRLSADSGNAADGMRGEGDVTLAEGWRFARDLSGKADWSAEAFDDSLWRVVRVPHDWAIEGPFMTNEYSGSTGRLPWKGVGWYRLRFDVSESEAKGCVFFDFGGVMASPEVYVNGRRAGGWDYGYASFRVDATPFVRPGRNVLAVRASTLALAARWYPGAGIYRRVVKRTRSRARFAYNGIFVTTPKVSRQRALVRVAWETENAPVGAKVKVRVLRNGRAVGEKSEPAALGAATLEIENPDLWDVDDPALHDAEVALVDADDRDLSRETVRFGIRSIAFPVSDDSKDRAANGFHLNGRRVQLRGANLHSDLGLLGMAFDKSAARRQLSIMKDMGANALRTSHNPPASELLDLCDEMGILVWDEAFDKWDAYGGRRDDQPLEEYVASNLVAFVRRDRNHPSVIVWSIGNEIWEWNPANPIRDADNALTDHGPSGQTRERNGFFRDQVRLFDATRPVGNGNRPSMNKDCIFDLGIFDPLDVVGWNYNHSYAAFKKRYPKKVVVYSESASAISSYGVYLDNALGGRKAATRLRGDGPAQVDSRDLQSIGDIVDEAMGFMDDDPYCCGDFVWTGFDYLGEPAPFSKEARSSYFGIVDLTGVPKDRFYLYRSNWNRKSSTLHISPDTWTFPGKEGQNVPVMVYTDAPEAELFLNGRSLGCRRKGEKVPVPASVTNGNFSVFRRYRLMWLDVPYEKGELKAVGIRDGKPAEERVLRTAGAPARLKIEMEPPAGKDEEELVWVHAYAYDAKGNRTLSADDEVDFSISGPGTILGVGNGDPCEHVSFAILKGHRLFGGVATAVVRRTGPGALSITVSSPKLSAAVAEVP